MWSIGVALFAATGAMLLQRPIYIAAGAAKGIVYSLVETLGTMVGDPDLPAHLKSGYMGALDLAVELEAKLAKIR